MLSEKIEYQNLNARQKEIFNFQKVSSILADYWYTTIKLSDDRMGADFIAIPFKKWEPLYVQLKWRFTVDKKYIWKNLFICFFDRESQEWYLYNHDKILNTIISRIAKTKSWTNEWWYSWPKLWKEHKIILYKSKLI